MSKPNKSNQQMRITMLFFGILMLFLLVHLMVNPQKEPNRITFSEFIAAVELPAEIGQLSQLQTLNCTPDASLGLCSSPMAIG